MSQLYVMSETRLKTHLRTLLIACISPCHSLSRLRAKLTFQRCLSGTAEGCTNANLHISHKLNYSINRPTWKRCFPKPKVKQTLEVKSYSSTSIGSGFGANLEGPIQGVLRREHTLIDRDQGRQSCDWEGESRTAGKLLIQGTCLLTG